MGSRPVGLVSLFGLVEGVGGIGIGIEIEIEIEVEAEIEIELAVEVRPFLIDGAVSFVVLLEKIAAAAAAVAGRMLVDEADLR